MAKPSPEALWNTEFFQKHAGAALALAMDEYKAELILAFERTVRECESPLEAAFAAWWVAMGRAYRYDIWPMHQVEVSTRDARNWRLDLVLRPLHHEFYHPLTDHPKCPKIAVELDGHEFHERTKFQVTHRNQRDRALTAEGWQVLHVSGSEFHADPEKCINDTYRHAQKVFLDAMVREGLWRFPVVTGAKPDVEPT